MNYREILDSKRENAAHAAVRAALTPVSWIYSGAAAIRNFTFDLRLRKIEALQRPAVSVGNLTVGGTGKTPCVLWILQFSQECGWRAGLLTRGYGGDGAANDEIDLIKNYFPAVPIAAGGDRAAGAAKLLATNSNVQFFLLDDGFQHRRAARDLDIVLIDATNPFGYGYCLPRGLLRESVRGLRRAHGVIVTRADQADLNRLELLWKELENFGYAGPRIEAAHAPKLLKPIGGRNQPRELNSLRGKSVHLLSAVGNPASLETTVTALGARVAEHIQFPDHHRYLPADLPDLRACETERGEEIWITTEKDAVKLKKLGVVDGYALSVKFTITRGERELKEMLNRVILESR
ncbi:MAG: tetraacyldisaccharide 4'-kinase [Planctomycetota bacterium]